MANGRQIELIRQQCGLSVVDVCNIMGVTEGEYRRIITNKLQPTIYQLCMFISETKRPIPGLRYNGKLC